MTDETKTRAAILNAAVDFLTNHETFTLSQGGTIEDLPIMGVENVAMENVEFNTEGKGTWASIFYRPNQPTGRTVGKCGSDMLDGFVQIDINVAPNTGEEELVSWEKKARLYFRAGSSFTYEGQSVTMSTIGMSQGRHVENNYRKSLTLPFKSYVQRTPINLN